MSGLVDLTADDEEVQFVSSAAPQAPVGVNELEIQVIEACTARKEVVRCAPTSTVRQLKRLVEGKFDRPSASQRLIFQGQELKPFTKTLQQFGLKSTSRSLIVHLAGNKPPPTVATTKSATQVDPNKKAVVRKRKSAANASGGASKDREGAGSSSSSGGASGAKRRKQAQEAGSSSSSAGTAAAVAAAADAAAIPLPNEKRIKRLRSPNQKLRDRQHRALGQRMFLVSRKEISDDAESMVGLAEEFTVLGSTGNVYTVTVRREPHCTCPDHAKGNLCKHIIFVMLRVLGISADSNLWYQAALLQRELASIFANAPRRQASAVMANASVRRALASGSDADGNADAQGADAAADADADDDVADGDEGARKPFDGEDCAICFEVMTDKEDLVWDRGSCGKSMHRHCFSMWASHSARSSPGGNALCPSCRGVWISDLPAGSTASAAAGGGVVQSAEGYVNLASLQGISSERPAYTPSGWRPRGRGSRW